jgi:hypothetical protein
MKADLSVPDWVITFEIRGLTRLAGQILSIEGRLDVALLMIELQHVAEERPLFNCIVQRYMRVGKLVKPLLWHVAFAAFAEVVL